MIRILLPMLLCATFLQKSMFVQSSGDECSINTECRLLRQCPEIIRKFRFIRNVPYCKIGANAVYVCCPVPPQPYVPPKDNDKRIVRECKSYQNTRKVCDKSLIVGGKNADPKEFPFMALLFYVNGDQRTVLCGGSLVSDKYVVTAAHCFYVPNEPNIVRLGELDYNKSDDDAAPVDFSIATYKIHDEYDDDIRFHDIAVVKLNASVQFNDYIVPACLPLADGRDFKQFLATGWGALKDYGRSASHLQKVKLDNFNDELCLSKVDKAAITINTTIQMCAGSFYYERDTCAGDSGGPLFVDHPDYNCLFLVLGVTSYGEGGCANKGLPSFYTRLSVYVDWIEKIVWG